MRIAHFVRRQIMGWAVQSQQVSRRNALMSSTEMADRRRERVEVDEFLEAHLLTFRARRANLEKSVTSTAV